MARSPWSGSVTRTTAGTSTLKAAPSAGAYVIDALTITGRGGAVGGGSITIQSRYKRTITVHTHYFPATAAFRVMLRKKRFRGLRLGDLTVTTSANVTVTVTASGTTEHDRIPEAALPCVLDGEHLVLGLTQPDSNAPITAYTYSGEACGIVDPRSGTRYYPSRSFTLPTALAATPFAEQAITTSGSGESHTIYFSTRNGQITRWESDVGTGAGAVSWMNRCDYGRSAGLGTYGRDNVDLVTQRTYNPTTQGGQIRPFGLTLSAQQRLVPSIIVPSSLSYASGSGAYLQVGVHPMHYDADGHEEGGAPADHGGGQDNPTPYWDDIHFPRWDFLINGLSYTHRISYWTFNRIGRPDSALFDGFQFIGVTMNNMMTRAEWRTIGDDNPVELVSFRTATTGTATASPVNVEASGDLAAEASGSDPFTGTGAYVAAVMSASADPANPDPLDFSVALACKFSPDWFTSVADRLGAINNITVTQLLGNDPGTPHNLTPEDFPDAHTLSCSARSFTGRRPGWMPMTAFVLIAPYGDMRTALPALYASGLMDQHYTSLPDAVTANTSWPDSRIV